jgi:hypothetical protein
MRIIPALVSAGLVVGVATAVVAQTAPAPTNPNTKVYSYQQTAPAKAQTNTAIQQQQKADQTPLYGPADPPLYGSPKWWEMQNRFNGGGGEGGG